MIDVIGHTQDPLEVESIIAAAGLKTARRFELRHDVYRFPADWTAAQTWHHEGPDLPGCGVSKGRVVMWAFPEASEFRLCPEIANGASDDRIVVAGGEVVVVDNARVEHRMPRRFSPDRWFGRAWLQMEASSGL